MQTRRVELRMNRTSCQYWTGLASIGLAIALLGNASAESPDTVKVKLPYSARLSTTYLPAGDYTISAIAVTSEAPLLLISSSLGGSILAQAIRVDMPVERPAEHTEVVLTHDGDYRVHRVWIAGKE